MNPNNPPSLNPYGGYGNEVGPTRGSLTPTPDAVINNLSAQLDNALALVVKKQKSLDELRAALRERLAQEPLTFLKIDLLNIIDL
jgi:nitrogen regulatory protein PII-like uncharacterized protein